MAERDPRIVGERIAKLRHQLDITQIELAAELGVSSSTVADWERGARFPRRKLGKVEKFFGQRIDYEEGSAVSAESDGTDDALDSMQLALDRLRRARDRREGKGQAESTGAQFRAV